MKNKLKKTGMVLGLYALATLPLANCKKEESLTPLEKIAPITSLEQEVKHISHPIRILINSRSMQSYDAKEALEAYKKAFTQLDHQAEQAGVDFIESVGLYKGDDIIRPGRDWVILESLDNFYYGTINSSVGEININSSVFKPRRRALVAKKLLMQHLIGKSDDPEDLTYDRSNLTPKKLSKNELYKLAEMYGTVKIK